MKKILSFVLLFAMSFTLFACGSSSSDSDSEELTKVTLGTTAWPTNMFYYLAQEQGYFEENGVEVDIQDFQSTTESTNAFIGGKLDFCTFASPETISPYYQGAEFKVVLETDLSNGSDGLVATSDITSAADLKGKTIATQLYSVDHMFLLMYLEENGMTSDDVNIVDMTIQESANAFIAGQVDAACVWEPYFSEAVNAGGNALFSSKDNPSLLTDALGASDELIESNPDAVKAVVKSFYQAVDYWKENTDEANEIMAEKLGVDADEFASEMDGLIIPTLDECIENFTESEEDTYWGYTQNKIKEFLFELNVIDSDDFDCGDMIDDQFVKALADED